MRDTITIRSNELAQLLDAMSAVIDLYRDTSLEWRASLFEMMRYTLERKQNDEFERDIEFGPETWDLLVTGLNELDGQKYNWLATKIARRAELDGLQMGYTTTVPFMMTVTGEKPTRTT